VILRRISLALAGAAVLATSAAVAVIALAFALYAFLLTYVIPAAAAAIVAAVAALVIAVGGLLMARGGRRPREKAPPARTTSVVERAIALFQERPVVAIAAAAAVGFMAIRNPRYLGAAVRAFVEGREAPPRAL
jgi:hypothetical protein